MNKFALNLFAGLLLSTTVLAADASPLFDVKIFMDGKGLSDYQFSITPDGRLCPMRKTSAKGAFELFSKQTSNQGCLELSAFDKPLINTTARAEFKSENNKPKSIVNGKEEHDGKIFRLEASPIVVKDQYGPNINTEAAYNLRLKLTGKTYSAKAGMELWAEGVYTLKVRFEKLKNGNWRVLKIAAPVNTEFDHVEVYVKSPGLISGGWNLVMNSMGEKDNPFTVTAKEEQIHYSKIED